MLCLRAQTLLVQRFAGEVMRNFEIIGPAQCLETQIRLKSELGPVENRARKFGRDVDRSMKPESPMLLKVWLINPP